MTLLKMTERFCVGARDDGVQHDDTGGIAGQSIVIAGYDPQSGVVWSAKRGLSFSGGECGG